jgi:hypothetical protein
MLAMIAFVFDAVFSLIEWWSLEVAAKSIERLVNRPCRPVPAANSVNR